MSPSNWWCRWKTRWRPCEDGSLQFIGCSSHLLVAGFPEWRGVKLLCAQSQGMYWFLVMRADLGGAGRPHSSQGPPHRCRLLGGMRLRRLLAEAGIDPARDGIGSRPFPAPMAPASILASLPPRRCRTAGSTDSGPTAWAPNSRCAAASARSCLMPGATPGKPCFNYTMPSVAATDPLIAPSPDGAAAVQAIINTQQAPQRCGPGCQVGRKSFPQPRRDDRDSCGRDLPYYDASISPDFVGAMTQFSRDVGILKGHPATRTSLPSTSPRVSQHRAREFAHERPGRAIPWPLPPRWQHGRRGAGDDIEILRSDAVNPPGLPFSDGVRIGGLVIMSGMLGIKPHTMELAAGGLEGADAPDVGEPAQRAGGARAVATRCGARAGDARRHRQLAALQ